MNKLARVLSKLLFTVIEENIPEVMLFINEMKRYASLINKFEQSFTWTTLDKTLTIMQIYKKIERKYLYIRSSHYDKQV